MRPLLTAGSVMKLGHPDLRAPDSFSRTLAGVVPAQTFLNYAVYELEGEHNFPQMPALSQQ